jgi:uncharacterized protein with PQ loop repeat
MEYETFLSVLSTTATLSTFGLFLCGLQICKRIASRGSTDGTSIWPFLLTLISCTFWLGYGDLRNDQTIIFVNGVGFIVQGLYLAYYYSKTRLKSRINRQLSFEFLCCIFTTWFVRSSGFTNDEKENFLGFICMVLNVASISAPLMDVVSVFNRYLNHGVLVTSHSNTEHRVSALLLVCWKHGCLNTVAALRRFSRRFLHESPQLDCRSHFRRSALTVHNLPGKSQGRSAAEDSKRVVIKAFESFVFVLLQNKGSSLHISYCL